jgi:hypothetical protein
VRVANDCLDDDVAGNPKVVEGFEDTPIDLQRLQLDRGLPLSPT